jgi:prepilin-type processing-associated H-X9-DG protein
MRDLLIRYLLGELDEPAQRQLEERLRQSPELRRELSYLQACFSESGEAGPNVGDPPPGLAQRTTEQVTNLSDDEVAPVRSGVFSAIEPPSSPASWSMADISVAAGVFLAVSMLLLPALRGSRDTSRKNVCANNQRQIGRLLVRYADDHNGYLPRVGPQENAGIFAARLVKEGYVTADELKLLLVCPASKQREQLATGEFVIAIPTIDRVPVAPLAVNERQPRPIGFSYSYVFGYVDRSRYHCYRTRRRACEPILADAAKFDASGRPQIANHNGCGINVLFADGHVGWQKILSVPGLDDWLYVNRLNQAAAGQGPDDVVLGGSDATPRVDVQEAD